MTDDLFSIADKEEKAPQKTNAPEMSVSELAFSLKRTLEDTYGRVRIRGELSRVKIHTSGHMYSDLKDDNAVINLVCWRGQLAKLSIKPEEGLEVICTGKVSSFPARSNYQLIVESMELAGEGALLKLLEERKKKLAAEGLFDSDKKRPLPFLPQTIGVVTSETGAVFHDILHRIRERFPMRVILWPVPVQGKGANEQIAKAIHGFNAMPDGTRPDVLIVGRGGGSLEDLMAFNEEDVVRAVAQSRIPVISSVGHETDTTLIDYVADRRAPTPTGAAEMAVPERMGLLQTTQDLEQRLLTALRRTLADLKNRFNANIAKLGSPQSLLDAQGQKLDYLADKANNALSALIQKRRIQLVESAGKLMHPRERLAYGVQNVKALNDRLIRLSGQLTEKEENRLQNAGRLLETLSFKSTLKRGFIVMRDASGTPVTEADSVVSDTPYTLEFKDEKRILVQKSG